MFIYIHRNVHMIGCKIQMKKMMMTEWSGSARGEGYKSLCLLFSLSWEMPSLEVRQMSASLPLSLPLSLSPSLLCE
jgi:hypothetical protein